MNTEDLIHSLSKTVPPVPRHALERRIALGMIGGGAVTVLLVIFLLGIRPDLHAAMYDFSFWMKWAYTMSLGVVAVGAVLHLARPTRLPSRAWFLGIPALILAGIGAGDLLMTPQAEWLPMWLGHSWVVCPWIVLMLAVPIFIGLLWSFRKLAPTRLRAAGAAAGLAAGAWAAAIYCLHCAEVSAIFVLTWYSLGIVLAACAGALLGPRLLRW